MPKVKLLISPELEAIVGKKEASRAEVINLVRVYLNGKKMKCEDNKTYFVPDKKIAKVFGPEKFRNCSIGEYIDAHLSPIIAKIDSDEEVTFNYKKQKSKKEDDNSVDAADDLNDAAVDGPNLSTTNAKNDSDDSSHIEPQESDDFTDLGIIYLNETLCVDLRSE